MPGAQDRIDLIRKMQVAIYWRNKHANRLDELIEEALDTGFKVNRIARIVGVSEDTIRRQYIQKTGRRYREGVPPSPEAVERVREARIAAVLLRAHG